MVWQVAVFVLDGARWHQVRWVYHVCFWACVVSSVLHFGWFGPLVVIPVMWLTSIVISWLVAYVWLYARAQRPASSEISQSSDERKASFSHGRIFFWLIFIVTFLAGIWLFKMTVLSAVLLAVGAELIVFAVSFVCLRIILGRDQHRRFNEEARLGFDEPDESQRPD
jgi:uncharacterized membrane protein